MEKTKKIVIVDDDIDIITVVASILKAKGYEVFSANDKTEGLQLIRSIKPDLAILDVMMTTQFEGFELAKELVEDKSINDIPVIIQTSIEVLTTTKASVQAMAREFRNSDDYSDLRVILVKDMITGNAGVDYLDEKGKNVWFPVSAFVRKPVSSDVLLPEVARLLTEVEA